jgi:DNA-binding ferritin-like protein
MQSDRLTIHLRELADVARVLEKETATSKCRRVMAKLAADYEALARHIEEGKRQAVRAEASC